MKIDFSSEDLRPLVAEVVAETIRQLGHVKKPAIAAPAGADGLLDARAAAKRLGIGQTTLREIPAGELPVVRIGRRCLYRPADLDVYVQRRMIESS